MVGEGHGDQDTPKIKLEQRPPVTDKTRPPTETAYSSFGDSGLVAAATIRAVSSNMKP